MQKQHWKITVSISALLAWIAYAPAVLAEEAKKEDISDIERTLQAHRQQLKAQEEALAQQIQSLQEQQKQLVKQRNEMRNLEKKVTEVTGREISHDREEVGTDYKPEEKQRPPEVAALAEEGGVLLPKGAMVIEPSMEYSRSSALRVAVEGFTIIPALNIGSFEITEVDRDTSIAAVSGRLGLTNRLEISAKVPYVHRGDTTLSRPFGAGAGADQLRDVGGDGLGDIEAGLHYQINSGQGGWPYFIGNLRFKSRTGTDPFEVPTDPATGLQLELPTGSGFYAWQPSITAIYPSDPIVYYANIGYLFNMERDVGTLGTVNPGDSISASFGMGLALNDRASISFGYSHDTVFETEVNGIAIQNSDLLQVGSFDVGYAYRVTDNVNVNFNVNAGLTDDAPDVRLLLRVPVRMSLF